MKRIIILILCVCSILGFLVGCGEVLKTENSVSDVFVSENESNLVSARRDSRELRSKKKKKGVKKDTLSMNGIVVAGLDRLPPEYFFDKAEKIKKIETD